MDFEIPTLSSATEITGSDHKILTTSWKTMLKKWGNAKAKKWQKRRKVYKYDKMEEEDWLNFGRHIETELQKYKERIMTCRDSVCQDFDPLPFKPPSDTTEIILEIEEIRSQLIKFTEVEIKKINTEDLLLKREETIKKLKETKKMFWTARNIENNNEQNARIKYYTERRYNDMKENTTRMINSILNKRTDKVNWEKICTLEDVIVEEDKIKTAAKQHFQTWTGKNPTNMEHWEEWSKYYEAKDIPKGIYDDLIKDIDDEELNQTITKSPNQKATGPTNTSNEMLKNILAGPRKILENTRPITLIEHAQKILTKILTTRPARILTISNVLSPWNFAALPQQSTMQLMNNLINIIEDAEINKQELWLLAQDMSKALTQYIFH
ncbi:hypothetical protein C2G38_2172334 [Gigaspora rosea]|uniref:Uncharacterized protein n=1 Tax=Gigaspora rosea TaxID=44941 RepID=A0A397VPY3_9GLOM|nr:hypothetical protein C2G38_2172334 [Gigaspora rosea]